MQRSRSAPSHRTSHRPGSPAGAWVTLFLVALALRLVGAWLDSGPGAVPSSATAAADDAIAWNLASGHGFSLVHDRGLSPTAFRAPLVPWITSLLYRAVGHRYFEALLLQAVIGAVIPLLVAWFGAAVFGTSAGLLAGWLVALHPSMISASGDLVSETTFAAALLFALFVTVEWIKTPRPARALGAGIAWGIAALAHPTAFALTGLVALWAWSPLGLTVSARDRVRQVALVLMGLVLTVGPWTARNGLVLHAFVPVSTDRGQALLDANNPIVWSRRGLQGGPQNVHDLEPYASRLRGLSEPAADRLAGRLAIEFLREHVREWPALAMARLGRFWSSVAERPLTGPSRRAPVDPLSRWFDPRTAWSMLTLPFVLWGLVRVLRGPRRWFQSLSVLVILASSAIALVDSGSWRSRSSIEPLVMLLGAVGLEDARRRLRARASGLKVVEGSR